MKLRQDLCKILKLLSPTMALYAVGGLTFIGGYVYVDYANYLSSSQIAQQAELKTLQRKLHSNIETLKKLGTLTAKRIGASHKDLRTIQNILNSSHSLLPEVDNFKIEKMTYDKLSRPQSRITRFGTLSLRPEQTPPETPNQKGPVVVFNKESVACRSWVFNTNGNVEGFLEVFLDSAAFKATLPLGDTLAFTDNRAHVLLQQKPFSIYGKLPATFWKYFIEQKSHCAIFFLFMLFSFVSMALSIYWLWLRLRQLYSERFQTQKNTLSMTQMDLEKAKAALFSLQGRLQSYQVSFQAYKKFQAGFRDHQKEQAKHLLKSLDGVMNFLQRANVELLPQDSKEIRESCVKIVDHLRNGAASQIRNEPVKILNILDNIQELFAEKIHKAHVSIEISCSENLFFEGDGFFMEFVLINVIGKAFYSVPPQGKINIKATHQKEGLHIHIKDNGFFSDKKIQNQLNQSFDFFMSQENFYKLCQSNQIICEYHRAKNGFNSTKILFSRAREQSESNVVHLFKRK